MVQELWREEFHAKNRQILSQTLLASSPARAKNEKRLVHTVCTYVQGDYWGFDTRSVTVQYTETVAVLKVSSEVIKCPTIGAASFGQSPYVARLLPVRGVVGHNIDRYIMSPMTANYFKI